MPETTTPPEKRSEDTPRPLGEHFGEMRRRLLISAGTVVLAAAVTWSQLDHVNRLVLRPLHQAGSRLVVKFGLPDREDLATHPNKPSILVMPPTFKPTEGFVYAVKLGILVGILAATPIILFQIWAFVAPGLTRRERRIIRPVFLFGAFFFLAGAAMAYYWVVPTALYYLAWVDWWLGFHSMWRIAEYSAFLISLLLVFGLAFELPLVMCAIGFAGLIRPSAFLRPIRYVIAAAFVLGAVLTPPDVSTQIMMATTLIGLYFLGVGFAKVGYHYSEAGRREKQEEENNPYEHGNGS